MKIRNLYRPALFLGLTATLTTFFTACDKEDKPETPKEWIVSTLAGTSGQNGFVNGVGAAARFYNPMDIDLDAAGNIYVIERWNHAVRKITPNGTVTTLAGSGEIGDANGTGTAAKFDFPTGITVDRNGNVYVADQDNHVIRKITPNGVVTTLAGTTNVSGFANGAATTSKFYYPFGVTVDNNGNVYVADRFNHAIRKISPTGEVSTFAGAIGESGNVDGTGTAAKFNYPTDLDVDAAGNVYVSDNDNHVIRKITPAGVVTTVAGSSGVRGSANGTGTAATFSNPYNIAVDASGNLYVGDMSNHVIRKITTLGVVSTFAGIVGEEGNDDGKSSVAKFSYPRGVAVDAAGNVYVADEENATIRKITLQ
jgi:sugar lactone lactonase YvrE